MKVVHYTDKSFKLHPIIIKNGDGKTGLLIKPNGGLWCSPLESENGWIDWCKSESFGNLANQQKVILNIDTNHFAVIDSEQDMERKLPWYQFEGNFWAIDFKKMVEQGIDGIHLTAKGLAETRWTHPKTLYGWDCETILIMNEGCIKSVEV
jgi:hypothetical protein